MKYDPINLREKLSKIEEHWSPRIIAEMNDYQFKLAKIAGEFVWHHHADTDEVFLVIEGNLEIEFKDGKASLKSGEMFVVPSGVAHRPVAKNECKIMLIEPKGVKNTGNVDNERTLEDEVWI